MKCVISCVIFTIVITIQTPEELTPEGKTVVEGRKAPAAPVAPSPPVLAPPVLAPPVLEDPSTAEPTKTESASTSTVTVTDSSKEEPNKKVASSPSKASTASEEPSVQLLDKPILPADAPDWVRAPQVSKGELRFAIPTATAEDLEQCYEEFDSQLLPEVQKMLETHVLRETSASQLAPLTKKYIEDHWLVQDCEYDQVVELPSGTYHQLWKQVYISKEQLDVVRGWEEKSILRERISKVGALGGASIGGMMLLSGLVGVLARRESRKLKA
jgi:hypothetical protein